MNDDVLVALDAELKRLRDTVFESWKVYMSWYTWFFGANLLVLGWILTRKADAPSATNVRILALTWIVFNLLGTVGTFQVRTFTETMSTRADLVCRLINERTGSMPGGFTLSSGLAGRLTKWAAVANGASLIANATVWLYVFATAGR
jgi:hypothetical protein